VKINGVRLAYEPANHILASARVPEKGAVYIVATNYTKRR
jgi:hypothetical protein